MRICVFCGSSPGFRPEYLGAAQALGADTDRVLLDVLGLTDDEVKRLRLAGALG